MLHRGGQLHQGEPVAFLVPGEERDLRILMDHAGPEYLCVPVDHLGGTSGFDDPVGDEVRGEAVIGRLRRRCVGDVVGIGVSRLQGAGGGTHGHRLLGVEGAVMVLRWVPRSNVPAALRMEALTTSPGFRKPLLRFCLMKAAHNLSSGSSAVARRRTMAGGDFATDPCGVPVSTTSPGLRSQNSVSSVSVSAGRYSMFAVLSVCRSSPLTWRYRSRSSRRGNSAGSSTAKTGPSGQNPR